MQRNFYVQIRQMNSDSCLKLAKALNIRNVSDTLNFGYFQVDFLTSPKTPEYIRSSLKTVESKTT